MASTSNRKRVPSAAASVNTWPSAAVIVTADRVGSGTTVRGNYPFAEQTGSLFSMKPGQSYGMAARPNVFTKFAVRYPVRNALASGAFAAVVGTILIVNPYGFGIAAGWGLAIGAAFAVVQWLLWRPGGLFRRQAERLLEAQDGQGQGMANDQTTSPQTRVRIGIFEAIAGLACLIYGIASSEPLILVIGLANVIVGAVIFIVGRRGTRSV
jgi:uncharacterized membrane protein HdeD (DUF308 family)